MKTADLTPGTLYALGQSLHGSRAVGMVLDNSTYVTVYDAASNRHTGELVKSGKPSKYSRADYGVPVATTHEIGSTAVSALTGLGKDRIPLQAGKHEIDGVEVFVRLRRPQEIDTTWDEHVKRTEAASAARQVVEEARRARRQENAALADRIKALLPDVTHRVDIETGQVTVYDGKALAGLLERSAG